MASRITFSFLNAQVDNLNRMMDLGNELYTYDENGKITGGVKGVYRISGAYGGYSLRRMHKSTGEADVFKMGHIPARQLSELIDAYMCGIREVKGN